MQQLLILLLNFLLLGTARTVSLKDFDDDLVDLSVLKRQEPEYICKDSPVDISLIIDSSRSIYPFDFQKQIDFLIKFVTLFDIHPNKVRVAAVSFGSQVILQGAFTFNKYNSTKEVQDGLRRIAYRGDEYGEGTNTALAIAFVRKRFLRSARPDAKKLCIVLTDGRSTDPRKTLEEAALIKKENVQMVAIGIGNRISMEELKGIASSTDFVFTVDNHSLLKTIKKRLILKICKDIEIVTAGPPLQKDEDIVIVTTETPFQKDEKIDVVTLKPLNEKNNGRNSVTPSSGNKTPETIQKKGCKGPTDINFIFNPSQVGTRRIIKFIENSVSSEALTDDDVRIGIITAPFPDITGFRLNRYKNKKEIKNHFEEYGTNFMAPLLADLRLEAFLRINGGRPDARRIGIIFLRGKVDDALETVIEAKAAHADGIEIYTIAIGDTNSSIIVNNIATNYNYVMSVSSSNDLPDLSGEFIKLMCETAIM